MEVVGDFEYNTKDLIGHGAFAVVFKGRHRKNTNFIVAIKSITKKNLAKSQNLLGKEIKILKELTELHHENVVALLDCKETPHNVYLVMEYCNGGDLADYLSVKGTLSEDTIRLFLRQLAGAMKALHAKGIVHRDLKPQNILLSHNVPPVGGGKATCPQPTEMKLKIADFGFARFLQDGVMAATLCGSPMYMAPEVIMSLQYDAKADLWSLGTIVFQCLTGKAPFQAQTPQALKQFYEKNANLAPKIPPGTSAELAHLLLHLLRRNARDRMEFDDFFSHPFLQWPSAHRTPGSNLTPSHAASAVAAARGNPSYQPSSTGQLQPRPSSHDHHPRGSIPKAVTVQPPTVPVSLKGNAVIGGTHPHGGAAVPTNQPPVAAEPPEEQQLLICEPSTPPSSSPMSAAGHESASSHEDDFVLVPANIPSDNSCDSNSSEKHRSGDYAEPVVVRGHGRGKTLTYPQQQQHGQRGPQQGSVLPCPLLASPPRPSFLPVSSAAGTEARNPASRQISQPQQESPSNSPSHSPKTVVSNSSEPIPVPTHRETYHLIHERCSGGATGGNAAPLSNNPGSLKEQDNNNDEAAGRHRSPSSSPRSPSKCAVPRSQPISMKRTHDSHRNLTDISSLSPPAVQFMIGTPPGGGVCGNSGRRRSASGSSCGTPPPVTTWQVSPVAHCASGLGVGGLPGAGGSILAGPGAGGRQTPNNSPLRRSGTTTHLTGPLFAATAGVCCGGSTLPPILGSPSASRLPTSPSSAFMDFATADNAAALGGSRNDRDRCGNFPTAPDLRQPPFVPFGTRAMTLPEITDVPVGLQRRPSLGLFHETFGDSLPFGSSPPALEGPLTFVAPELPEETLLEREHNETLAKLNFVLALVDCIVELAKSRANPLAALTESLSRENTNSAGGNGSSPSSEGATSSLNLSVPLSEGARKAEQLVLLVRALQLLSSGLNLATQQLRSGQLQPSATVKSVVGQMNERFHYCLSTCKQLNSTGLLQRVGVDPSTTNITADKILYNHAIEMCQSAALDELFGNPQECFQRYQTAQILLHSLSQHVHHDQDKALLTKYKDAVEKRLYVLQQQGYIYAYDTT